MTCSRSRTMSLRMCGRERERRREEGGRRKEREEGRKGGREEGGGGKRKEEGGGREREGDPLIAKQNCVVPLASFPLEVPFPFSLQLPSFYWCR